MKNRRDDAQARQPDPCLCPTPIQLREFALGRLEIRDTHHLFEHLKRCQVCGRDLGAYCSFFLLKEAQLSAQEIS